MYHTIIIQLKIILVENSESNVFSTSERTRATRFEGENVANGERERERVRRSSSSSGERGRMQMLIALSRFRRKQDRCIDEFTRSRMIHTRLNHPRTSFQLATHCRQIYRKLKVRTYVADKKSNQDSTGFDKLVDVVRFHKSRDSIREKRACGNFLPFALFLSSFLFFVLETRLKKGNFSFFES